MTKTPPLLEYLVISRGKWDSDASPEKIQSAIDRFYQWHEDMVAQGKMKGGQRLASEGRLVSRGAITDGPFAEAKELVGGYWFILAGDLDEAARLAAGNPCLECGLSYEIRPVDAEKGQRVQCDLRDTTRASRQLQRCGCAGGKHLTPGAKG